jgi:hypothetical protein
MMDTKVWTGVQSLLDAYAKIRSDDTVAVLYTSDSYESAAWVSAALQLRDISVARVWMAPLHDDGFRERLASALPSPAELHGRLIVLSFERDTMSHGRVLANAISKYGKEKCLVFRAISSCSNLFSDALCVLPEELSARNTTILERCMAARRLRITTPGGTELDVAIDSKHRWISNRGTARAGGVVILPAGEVATFPASIDGVFVADFAFNVNAITDRDCRLHHHPVTVWIEEGRAIKCECDDAPTTRFLEECFHTHCAFNVGELGFGTNIGIRDAIPMNSHINERRPGIHLGFGQHNQDPGVVGYQCSIHLDLIARGGTVWTDADPISLDLENLAPSQLIHPQNPRDEDVFSPETTELEIDDCCGILTGDGLQLFCPPDSK